MNRTAVAQELVFVAKMLSGGIPKFKADDKVRFRHDGRMVEGTILHLSEQYEVRYYIIDIGKRESIEVPMDDMDTSATKIAKSFSAAGTSDLADVKSVLEDTYAKIAEYERKKAERDAELGKLWMDATAELNNRTQALLEAIQDSLVKYFTDAGIGVRMGGGLTGGLVEVMLGSGDGVRRYQSKVSVILHLTFKGRENQKYALVNENAKKIIEGPLKDKDTVKSLLAVVERAHKKGFWAEGKQS